MKRRMKKDREGDESNSEIKSMKRREHLSCLCKMGEKRKERERRKIRIKIFSSVKRDKRVRISSR